jgi:hypothetical protein
MPRFKCPMALQAWFLVQQETNRPPRFMHDSTCSEVAHFPGAESQSSTAAGPKRYKPGTTACAAAVGTIGLSLLDRVDIASLTCVEINGAGHPAFARSLLALPPEKRAVPASYRVCSAGTVPLAELAVNDVIVVDPPRKGLEASLIRLLTALPPRGCSRSSGAGQSRSKCDTSDLARRLQMGGAVAAPGESGPGATSSSLRMGGQVVQKSMEEPPCEEVSYDRVRVEGITHRGAPACTQVATGQGSCKTSQGGGGGVAAEPLNMCGATSGGVQRLDAPPPQRLVYLSCGLPALLRDLEELVDKGPWRVVYAHAFLFFPGTDSVETLVVMDREA